MFNRFTKNAIELVAVCAIIETTLIFYLSDMDKEPKNPCLRGGWPRSGKPLAWLRRGGTSSKVHDGYLLLILKIVLKIKKLKKKKKRGKLSNKDRWRAHLWDCLRWWELSRKIFDWRTE